jgi:hypothetical protein
MQGIAKPTSSYAVALGAGLLACGCVRGYAPRSPHVASTPGAEIEVTRLVVDTSAPALPQSPLNRVDVVASTRTEHGVALASARLAPVGAAPCTAGVEATGEVRASHFAAAGTLPTPTSTGQACWSWSRPAVDGRALLWSEPAALDVSVLHADGAPPGCLRVPLVDDTTRVEWEGYPWSSWGIGLVVAVPFHSIYGVDAMPVFALRGGRWVGPVRLRLEGLGGGAAAHATNPNLVGYAYGGGILADTLLFSTGMFGLGIAAGYDALGVSFSANVDALSHEGAGFQGVMHGPRGGLVFDLLPPPAPGGAFRARPDATSFSVEIYGAALWSQDAASATPAIWAALQTDGGF